MFSSVTVFAPATVANVGCGFDIFGLAVNNPGDRVTVNRSQESGVRISKITGDEGRLPKDPQKNTASFAVIQLLEKRRHETFGIEIELHKEMPIGSGMGSSSASAVAAVVAANELLGAPLTRRDLLPFVMKAEAIACGAAHADNVAPSLLGGFILIRNDDPLDVIKIETPPDLIITLVHPNIEIKTEEARAVMKKELRIQDAVRQSANTAGLVAGFFTEDYALIGRSIQDLVAEPSRSMLIPGFKDVINAAATAGALGGSISGAGPSVFALCKGAETAEKVKDAMIKAFKDVVGLESEGYVSPINQEGAKILNKE